MRKIIDILIIALLFAALSYILISWEQSENSWLKDYTQLSSDYDTLANEYNELKGEYFKLIEEDRNDNTFYKWEKDSLL